MLTCLLEKGAAVRRLEASGGADGQAKWADQAARCASGGSRRGLLFLDSKAMFTKLQTLVPTRPAEWERGGGGVDRSRAIVRQRGTDFPVRGKAKMDGVKPTSAYGLYPTRVRSAAPQAGVGGVNLVAQSPSVRRFADQGIREASSKQSRAAGSNTHAKFNVPQSCHRECHRQLVRLHQQLSQVPAYILQAVSRRR